MRSDDPRDSQQQYWNTNLDPQNLGGGGVDESALKEAAFYHTPDQDYALAQLAPISGKTILELGCGLGVNTLHLAEAGATVVAIDIARARLSAVHQAVKPHHKVLLVQAAAEALPFRDGVFDAAYSKSVLIHTHLDRSIPQLHRVLKRTGIGTFVEPLASNPLVNLYRRTLAPKEWQSIVTYFTDREIELFRRQFTRLETSNFYGLSFLAFGWQFAVRAPRLFRLSLQLLRPLDWVLFQVPSIRDRAWFTVLVARKE